MDTERFASRLRAKRAEIDITQEELSKRTGLSMATICSYEQAKTNPSFDSIDVLCRVLNISPNYLLGWEEPLAR